MKLLVSALLGIVYQAEALSAQGHPLFDDIPGYVLIHQEQKQDALNIPLNQTNTKTVKGLKTLLQYEYQSEKTEYSSASILNYYYNQIKNLQGKPLFKGKNFGAFSLVKKDKEFWIVVEAYEQGKKYSLVILEKTIAADVYPDLLTKFKKEGHIALYINFSPNSTQIPEEDKQKIGQMAQIIRTFPSLNFTIEGHTDNIGAADANKNLSLKRANALKRELIKLGVSPKRLTPVGVGQEKPIADNNTEDGREKNRRVELVKN